MGATNTERAAPQAVSNVFQITPAAEEFAMRRKQLKQTINHIQQHWAAYREGDGLMARQVADNSVEAQAERFGFVAKNISRIESTIHNTTIWLRVPTSVGNPFGIGQEFSARTLAQAVDAAIEYVNLTKGRP